MAATISLVSATRPEGLLEAAGRQATSIAAINAQIGVQQGAMTQLGAAGRAAPRRRRGLGPRRTWPGSVSWSGGWRRCPPRCARAVPT